ncbi:phasin [Cupriavidus basilensis OR16]|uniref:Phasin n=1 Tax=Cupriavidus basilensis OR16 TaxID=1127483 RepID=H1SH39_9BURK|nr:TIGR01841 family phasin [Cupriavidus basilensis]EHP38152.1 phasin [Cupriavidus basilensis OR16]
MNYLTPEQILDAQKESLDTLAGLTSTALEGFERLVDLNLQTMKAALAESGEGVHKALVRGGKPGEAMPWQHDWFMPLSDQALAYRRQFQVIASTTRADFDKAAEAHHEVSKRVVLSLMENLAGAAPVGAGAATAAWPSAIRASLVLYENWHATAKQALQVAQASFDTAAGAAATPAKPLNGKAGRQ